MLRTAMKNLTLVARVTLGLIFVVFGLNAFLHFIPLPPPKGAGAEFMGALAATHYLSAVKVFEITGGLLLLLGRWVPLGLTLLGPVIVNILFYAVFMDRSGLPLGVAVGGLELFLVLRHRGAFAGIFRA